MGCFDESVGKSFAHQEPSKSHRSVDASAAGARPSANLCFDCSICLDFAVDPVVTLCGHLYCWPCIYKWLQVETTSPQQCPVCKSPLSQNALVPLYGRGSSNLTAKSKGLDIPNRPAVLRNAITSATDEQQHPYNTNNEEYIALHRPMQQQPHHHHYYPSPWGGTRVFSSTAGGVLGGMAIAILSLVSRNNQVSEMHLPRSNQLTPSGNSPSQRMQERRVENSLHQLWVFLFCCAILGLLFF